MSDVTGGAQERRAALLVKLFDLRSFIGSLFIVFGVIVTIDGFVASSADIRKAEGINLSLWTGLAMLILGIVFIVWMLLAPPEVQKRGDDEEDPVGH